MEKVARHSETKHAWISCNYCTSLEFKVYQDFIRHLREKHCTREGGSYVCRYGYNGVCSSLPVEGVNDEDYEDHVYRHHVFPRQPVLNSRRSNLRIIMGSGNQMNDQPNVVANEEPWTIYSASQNLPAVLNDPNRGKQRDFFTKLWGDGFVEKTDIPKPQHLPEITPLHFECYMKKIARRFRKHARMNSNTLKPTSHNELLQHFPNLRAARSLERSNLDVTGIPKIFLQSSLDLSNVETFNSVFPFSREPSSPAVGADSSQHSGKLLQEKLSHYLDLVEVQIARQVAQKSQAFFHAMTSHDALMEQLTQTITVVKALREKINRVDKSLVKDTLNVIRLERRRHNHHQAYDKMSLMSTVHQTQPMIQLLLSTPDYVAALDLISTTQEILVQELAGVHSFRHLGSQLLEMERLIDKMLSTEFERYATADLNRPLVEDQQVLQEDKLVSIIFGMLRQKHFHFVDTYKEEAVTTIKAVIKQTVIEVVAASDSGDMELALTGVGDHLQGLSLHDWLHLMENTTSMLLCLIRRVKAVHDVMRQATDVSAGKAEDSIPTGDMATNIRVAFVSDPTDHFLSSEEHGRVLARLRDLLTSVCDYAHERVAHLVSTQSVGPNTHNGDKPGNSAGSYWLVDKATANQICDLARVINIFCEDCEKVCGKTSSALKSAFKVQASKFVQRFHADRKSKLGLILDSERWKQADVPSEFQDLVSCISESGKFSLEKRDPDVETSHRKATSSLLVGQEQFAVVGTVLLLLKMVAEYCSCAEDLPPMAANLCRNVAELLHLFNCRCCQLVLGAGALQTTGLKTITSTNLALASRALQLLMWLVPHIKNHFQVLLQQQQQTQGYRTGGGLHLLEAVEKDVAKHVMEIEGKVLSIVGGLFGGQLSLWEAKPPVPSQPFRTISRHLTKLHEAVANILPLTQVEDLYRTVHATFKDRLREQLARMNVVNNGGPQHGVVTSELTFYLETMKTLHALPQEELDDRTLEDIWTPR